MSQSLLAMHMSNELLSVPVAAVTAAVAFGAVALAARQSRKHLQLERLPLMGVMGAFVFAAQMINFSIPGLGTSGHLGGAVLLAILLGRANAIVTMAAILIIQCLLFQDGGLLAIGCNIINIGVVPVLTGAGVYRLALGPTGAASAWRQYLSAWLACLVGVTSGAALVPLEVRASGVAQIPTAEFLAIMIGVHLPIALVEGLITFSVLAYLRKVRPAALGLDAASDAPRQRLSRVGLALSIFLTAILLSGIASYFASSHPDGLEWTWRQLSGKHDPAPPVNSAAGADDLQSRLTPMPDYNLRAGWLSLAGVIGTAATLVLVLSAGRLLTRRRQGDSQRASANAP